ncbi:MAG: lipoprotein signal peptidase [Gammaproteobacteria bacterium]|nr:lipoprotein signal peptidase [Gammaproteobacteria bacterium]
MTATPSKTSWRLSPWFLLSGLVLGLDQWTKQWIIDNFEYGRYQAVFPHFNLTRLHNEGAAFSFLADAGGWQKTFFIVLGFAVSAVITIWIMRLEKGRNKLLGAGLALILGGALGNVIDRLLYGHVIDFLDFYYGTFHWPAFNVADSCIFLGAVAVILDSFVNKPAA